MALSEAIPMSHQEQLETTYLVMSLLGMLPPQYRLSRLDLGQQPPHGTAATVSSQSRKPRELRRRRAGSLDRTEHN
jgi:hypothetical protein